MVIPEAAPKYGRAVRESREVRGIGRGPGSHDCAGRPAAGVASTSAAAAEKRMGNPLSGPVPAGPRLGTALRARRAAALAGARRHSRALAWMIGGLALLIGTAAAEAAITQVIVFGDSSVDAGYYRALANPGASTAYNAYWAAAVAAGAGIPTSSPGQVYPQVLAAHFGLAANPANQPGGTNYATSGAKNVEPNTNVNGGFKAAIPTATQIANYLAATGNRADARALFLVSSGGNDVSFAAGLGGTGPFPADPAGYVTAKAAALVTAMASLKAAGAKYFVVANLPASFPLNNATERQLRAAYNQALFAGLANQGIAVIQADIDSLRVAINANPGQYGFTSTSNAIGGTACTTPAGLNNSWALLCSANPGAPSTFVAPDAGLTHLFADDQHLATAGQRIVADSIYNLVLQAGWAAAAQTGIVVEFYDPDLDNYFITADPVEQVFVDSGAVGRWQRTGNVFAAGGTSLVCRFYGNTNLNPATGAIYGPNSHFYTADPAECAGLKAQFAPAAKSWKFESNDFRTTPAANGTCPAALVPVYRAYNNGFARGVDSNHRITSNFAAYQQTVAGGWIGEGVVMCAPQ
jgi:phospholipase/lecithinase/hemolysin